MIDAGILIVNNFQVGINGMSEVADSEAEALNNVMDSIVAMCIRLAGQAGAGATQAFAARFNLSAVVRKELQTAALSFDSGVLRTRAFAAGVNVGFDLGRGVAAGIQASIVLSLAAIARLVSATFAAANSFAGIASPSKVFKSVGTHIGEGVAEGLLETAPALARAMESVIGAALPQTSASSAVRAIGGRGRSISASPLAAAALQAAGSGRGGSPDRAGASSPAGRAAGGVVVENLHLTAPTDDAEALAMRIMARLERRLQ